MEWNRNIQTKYRPFSIQTIDEIKIGDTIFTQYQSRVIKEILTNAEKNTRIGTVPDEGRSHWIKFGDCESHLESTMDMCIGACYNPWMVFKDEAIARAYYAELEPTINYDLDEFDDYY